MPRKPWHKDESGKKYGKLTVLRYLYTSGKGAIFECRCDCGKITTASGGELRSGNKRSCGCSRHDPRKPKADACIVCGSQDVYVKNMCHNCYYKQWKEKKAKEFERYL